MDLVIDSRGQVRCVYGEDLDLSTLGPMSISRASYVEPDELGTWYADMAPLNGPRLGPFSCRSLALDCEQAWLTHNWLVDLT